MRVVGLLRELEPDASAQLPSIATTRDQLPVDILDRVVAYLRSGDIASDAMEMVRDPYDRKVVIAGGSGLQSDGEWVWRQDLWHYVQRYRIALPADFISHVLQAGQPPQLTPEQIRAAMKAGAAALRGEALG